MKKLGVNIDHVATLRQARGGGEPDPYSAAVEAKRGGAHQITVHLREDRRHIQDADVKKIKQKLRLPLNLEMAADPKIVRIALRIAPENVCIVPERRQELTTEGGLDVCQKEGLLKKIIIKMRKKGIHVSLFIDPTVRQIHAAKRAGADAIEIHTGSYANAKGSRTRKELNRIRKGAKLAASLGLEVHAGHGLNYENTTPIARIPEIRELNIGHSIICRAVFVGMRTAVRQMLKKM